MGKQKEDLDISPPGGRSEREESAGECSLTQHGLCPIVISCITDVGAYKLYSNEVATMRVTDNRLLHGNPIWEGG